MMTFTKVEQLEHRKEFIRECRQKAWGAACHVEWISAQLTTLVAEYQKLQDEDTRIGAEIATLCSALDLHTVENRNKRKALQARRDKIAVQMGNIAKNSQAGQQSMQQLLQGVESALALAVHAEKWEWKEVESQPAAGSENVGAN